MKIRTIGASVLTSALLTAGLAAAPAAADESCSPSSEIRELIATFVADIRDDVKAKDARAATRLALVESMRTLRGERAETRQERRGLGEQISALASQQRDSENRVEGRALSAAIVALTEQRERRGRLTAEERKELKGAIAGLEAAVVARADETGEGEDLSTAIREIVRRSTCKPA